MKKIVIGIILVLLLASQAQAVQTVVEKKLLASEYGWLGEKLGWGDRLYKTTYADRTFEYKLERGGGLLTKASIVDVPAAIDVTSKDGTTNVPINFVGSVCNLFGSSKPTNNHMLYFYNQDKSVFFATGEVTVPCISASTAVIGASRTWSNFVIPNSFFGNMLDTNGVKQLWIAERIHYIPDKGGDFWMDSDTQWTNFRVNIPSVSVPTPISSPTPTPTVARTPTPTPKTGQCTDSYGNIFSCGTTDPAKYYLKVTSNVPGNVYVDGAVVGTTGNTFALKDYGGYNVEVKAEGYNNYRTSITVDFSTTSTTTTVAATLTAVSNSGGGSGSTSGTATATATATSTTSVVTYGTGATATATPAGGGEPTVTVTSSVGYGTGTPAPSSTSTIDTTSSAGTGGIVYRGVDITSKNGAFYVGDIPHDSIAEAKRTIDEMIAGKEQKPSFLDTIPSYGWAILAIVVLGGGYVLLSKKAGKGKKKGK